MACLVILTDKHFTAPYCTTPEAWAFDWELERRTL